MSSIQHTLQTAKRLITDSETSDLDAEVLLAHVLNVAREHLYMWPEKELTQTQQHTFDALLQKRIDGYPVAYLVGTRAFWNLNLKVTKDVLIPRPETELLIKLILKNYGDQQKIKLLDLGTGSGTIAIVLAHEQPNWNITATEISKAALTIAKTNAKNYQIKNIRFIPSDWFNKIHDYDFDIIVSNPPYVEDNDPCLKARGVCYEPKMALASGADGLNAIRTIISDAKNYLKPDGTLYLEHGFNQAKKVQEIFEEKSYQNIHSLKDLSQHDRVTVGSKAFK